MFGEKRRQVGRFEPADERTHVKEVDGEGCCRRCGGVRSEDVFLTCLEETQEVLRRLMLGCKEERFLTFLASSPHCGGLMSRGRDRANVQMGGTKSIGEPVVPAGRLSSRPRNSPDVRGSGPVPAPSGCARTTHTC